MHHSSETQIIVHDVSTGQQLRTVPIGRTWSPLELSADGNTVVTSSSGDPARVYSIEPQQELHQFREWKEYLWNGFPSADGRFVLLTFMKPDEQGIVVVVRNLQTGEKVSQFRARGYPEQFSRDGQYLIGKADTNRVAVWHISDGRRVAAWYGHNAPISEVAVLADNKIASGDNDGNIRIWTIPEGN